MGRKRGAPFIIRADNRYLHLPFTNLLRLSVASNDCEPGHPDNSWEVKLFVCGLTLGFVLTKHHHGSFQIRYPKAEVDVSESY